MNSWDAALYLKFEQARTRPCIDLVDRIEVEHPQLIVDLGCGPGNSTAVVAERFPEARIIGVDASAQMLERARRDYPRFEFAQADVAAWRAERPCDVILANAVLQWLPKHEELLPTLMNQLGAGGALAVQMPCNFDSPNHRALRDVAERPQWKEKITARRVWSVQPPEWYYDLLAPLSRSADVWVTEYQHPMDGHEDLLQWSRGTAMRPYTAGLSKEDQLRFESEYMEEIRKGYPLRANGKLLLPFKRIFVVAIK